MMKRISLGTALAASALLGWLLAATLRGGENFDQRGIGNPPEIIDVRWDRRMYDGTPGFPGRIPWRYNPQRAPAGINTAAAVAYAEEAYRTWESIDRDLDQAPLLPRWQYAGLTDVGFAEFDGVNSFTWGEIPGGVGWASVYYLTRPATTTQDEAGNTILTVSGLGTIPFQGPPGIPCPKGTILDGDFRLIPDPNIRNNRGRAFTTGTNFVSVDLPKLILHEIGHVLGLAHSSIGFLTDRFDRHTTMVALNSHPAGRVPYSDDRASIIRIYARGNGLPQTIGGRAMLTGTIISPESGCGPASGVIVRAVRLDTEIDSATDVETISGSQQRMPVPDQPYNGSFQLNLEPGTYLLYAAHVSDAFIAPVTEPGYYNQTTTFSNAKQEDGFFVLRGPLAVVPLTSPGQRIELGDLVLPGCGVAAGGASRLSVSPAPAEPLRFGQPSAPIRLVVSNGQHRPVSGQTVRISGPAGVQFTPADGPPANPLTVTTAPVGAALATFSIRVVDDTAIIGASIEIRVEWEHLSLPLQIPYNAFPRIAPEGIVHAASFARRPGAPGQIVSVFGGGLGPLDGVGASLDAAGRVAKTAGGVEVLFDGVAAPIYFARWDQCNVQVPYSVNGKAEVEVRVRHRGRLSPAMTVPVAAVSPGIFEMPDGANRAVVLNIDGSVNGPEAPATAGDVIVLYATGEGQTDPPGIDGQLAPFPGPTPVQPIRLKIGDMDAPLQFAGPAPGFAGLLQVNAVVPGGITPGPRVPLELQFGEVVHRTSVLAVRETEAIAGFGETLLRRGVAAPFVLSPGHNIPRFESQLAVNVPAGTNTLNVRWTSDAPAADALLFIRSGAPIQRAADADFAYQLKPDMAIVLENPEAGTMFFQPMRRGDQGTGATTVDQPMTGTVQVD
ncbi:MAG: hypothetical protein ACK5AZ_18205 [Bryobacteraceae bacterium]